MHGLGVWEPGGEFAGGWDLSELSVYDARMQRL
jgi:hypothetical protein